MRIAISDIKVNPGRREVLLERAKELAGSIAEIGMLNPITIDRKYTLIAGLHRLEAAKLLEWTEIECNICDLAGLQAELAEIDENFVRSDLSEFEFGELLLRRKDIYETLYPETKCGVSQARAMNKAKGNNVSAPGALTSKSFVRDTADKLGMSPRTVEEKIQIAKNLTPEAKKIIKDSGEKVKKKEVLKLSRLEPEQQKEAAELLSAKEIGSISEYNAAKRKVSDTEIKSQTLNPRRKEQDTAKQEEILNAQPEKAEDRQDPEQEDAQKRETQEPSSIPFSLGEKRFNTFKESVADLKDPNKDCSCTPDSFLAELTAFVNKIHREFKWYSTPYYEAAFPAISPKQLDYLRQQIKAIHTVTQEFLKNVERMIPL